MNTLTPSALRVCNAAMEHFAEYGYSAASLSKIGEAAGMRKASIYAHFSGKDELFMTSYKNALYGECSFVRDCFKRDETVKALPGYSYCRAIKQRYKSHASFRFLLMGAYFQPHSLKEFLDSHYTSYINDIGSFFGAGMRQMPATGRLPDREVERFTQAYLGIADSLHVELVYAGGRVFNKRLAAMWSVLSDSIGGAGMK